jgi:predicted RNase H-like HicB family nuclease
MRVKVRVFEAEEGGYWAVVPGLPNCVSEGETLEEVKQNVAEALQELAEVEDYGPEADRPSQLVEIDV